MTQPRLALKEKGLREFDVGIDGSRIGAEAPVVSGNGDGRGLSARENVVDVISDGVRHLVEDELDVIDGVEIREGPGDLVGIVPSEASVVLAEGVEATPIVAAHHDELAIVVIVVGTVRPHHKAGSDPVGVRIARDVEIVFEGRGGRRGGEHQDVPARQGGIGRRLAGSGNRPGRGGPARVEDRRRDAAHIARESDVGESDSGHIGV